MYLLCYFIGHTEYDKPNTAVAYYYRCERCHRLVKPNSHFRVKDVLYSMYRLWRKEGQGKEKDVISVTPLQKQEMPDIPLGGVGEETIVFMNKEKQ